MNYKFWHRVLVTAIGFAVVSACSTSRPPVQTPAPVVVVAPNPISATILQVQDKAKDICNFLPVAATVANILGSLTGQRDNVKTVTEVAQTICQVVAPATGKAGVSPRDRANGIYGRVNGVEIRGEFVQ